LLYQYIIFLNVSVADPGGLFRIRIFPSWIPDPGSKRFQIRIKEFEYFSPKTDYKFSEKLFGMVIPGPGSGFFFPIQDAGVTKAPVPGSGCATLMLEEVGGWGVA
jgi:hypothetical protein